MLYPIFADVRFYMYASVFAGMYRRAGVSHKVLSVIFEFYALDLVGMDSPQHAIAYLS